jgi:hypothetical protein
VPTAANVNYPGDIIMNGNEREKKCAVEVRALGTVSLRAGAHLSFEAKENSGENIFPFIITQVVVGNRPVATFAIIIIYRVDKETNES